MDRTCSMSRTLGRGLVHGVAAGWPEHWLAGGSKEYLAVMEGPYNTQRADLGRPLLDDDGQLFYLDPARL